MNMLDLRRDEQGYAHVPNGDRLDSVRSLMSGWHFSKECLTRQEREILYCAEQLLAMIDEACGGYAQ